MIHAVKRFVVGSDCPSNDNGSMSIDTTIATAHQTAWRLTAAGHDVRIFVELDPYLRAVLDDLRQAKRRIWIETYILGDDAAGQRVLRLLAQRAAEGLEVRLMVDAVGSLELPSDWLAEVEAAGGKVHVFHSFGFALWEKMRLSVLNRRNHRKLIVIDDRAAYVGGMNLVDPAESTGSAAWRDVHLRIEGPAVAEVAAAMQRLWQRAHGQRVKWPKWPLARLADPAGEALLLFDSLPALRMRRAARVFRTLIRSARRSVTLSMAYFIPQGAVLRELFKARRRGVTVRVIVPAESDVPLVHWAAEHFFARLLKHGIRIYQRRDRMLHGKVMLVDDRWSLVGSCNLDPRSLRWNLECLAVIRSTALAATMRRILAFELRNSQRVTPETIANRPWWQRLRGQIAWWFRRWL